MEYDFHVHLLSHLLILIRIEANDVMTFVSPHTSRPLTTPLTHAPR